MQRSLHCIANLGCSPSPSLLFPSLSSRSRVACCSARPCCSPRTKAPHRSCPRHAHIRPRAPLATGARTARPLHNLPSLCNHGRCLLCGFARRRLVLLAGGVRSLPELNSPPKTVVSWSLLLDHLQLVRPSCELSRPGLVRVEPCQGSHRSACRRGPRQQPYPTWRDLGRKRPFSRNICAVHYAHI